MKITDDNIKNIISKLGKTEIELTKTWERQNSRNMYAVLHKLEKAEGLYEFPLKSFKLEFGRKKFPFFNKNFIKALFNINRFNLKRFRFYNIYFVYKRLGIRFPTYNDLYRNFYYKFNEESFNANIAKYANFIEMQKKIIPLKNINTIEIGGGTAACAKCHL